MAASGEDLDHAIDQAYAAATGAASWDTALDACLQATGYDGAALFVFDKAAMSLTTTPQLVHGVWRNLNTEGQEDYAQHWFRHDPRIRYMLANPDQTILHDYLHTAERDIDRDPYYDWYLRTQDTRYYVGGQSDPSLPFQAGLTLHRRGSKGAAGTDDIARFGRLFAHLQRALQVEFRLHRSAHTEAGAGSQLERNPTGVVVLNRELRVLHANKAAETMAARADGFLLGQQLTALRPTDTAALDSMLAAATTGASHKPGPLLRLPRRGAKRDYLVMAAPTPYRQGLFDHWAAALCVLIIDPETIRTPPVPMLRHAFGLTAAEARLLAALSGGCSVEEAASQLEVTRSTIRSQLAALFRKTATNRQADLVRLALTLPCWD